MPTVNLWDTAGGKSRSWPPGAPAALAGAIHVIATGQAWLTAGDDGEYSYFVPPGEANPNAGYIDILGQELVTISGVMNYKFYVERVLGETGVITLNYATYSAHNVTAGVHYTPSSGSVSFNDRERGRKSFTIPVIAMPQGRGIIGVDLTGAAYRDRCYLSLNNGTTKAGAFYMNDNGGADSSTATGGNGSAGTPDVNPSTCVARAANGGHVYMLSGTYKHRYRRPGGKIGGMNVPVGSRSKTNPLVIEAAPGATVVMDLNYEGVHDNASGNWGCSCITVNPAASDIFIFGARITLQRSFGHAFSVEPTETLNVFSNHLVVDGLKLQDCGQQGPAGAGSDNVGAMFLYSCNNSIFQNNTVQRVYARDRGTSNPFDDWQANVTNGILAFHCQNISFVGNSLDVVGYGVAFKGGMGINTGVNHTYKISHNLFKRARDCVALEGYNYQNTPYGFTDSIIRYNVSDNPDLRSSGNNGTDCRTDNFFESWTNASDGSGYLSRQQGVGLEFSNNVVRNAVNPLDIQNQDGVFSHSNIFEGTTGGQYGVIAVSGRVSRILMSDNNLFYGGAGAQSFYVGGTNYSSLGTMPTPATGTWRNAPSSSQLSMAQPDRNSVTTAPSYANRLGGDYRTTLMGARGGKGFGVNDQIVGAQ